MKSKKILLINQGNTKNIGDNAIFLVIQKYFLIKGIDFQHFWDEELVYKLLWKIKSLRKLIIFSMKVPFIIDLFNKMRIKKAISGNEYEAVIIGGGELICAHHGFNSSMKCWTDYFVKKKVNIYLIGVSGDLNMRSYSQKRYENALKKCTSIFVRDSYTLNICKNHYWLNAKIFPDVVFSLNKVLNFTNEYKKEDIILFIPIAFNDEVICGLNVTNESDYFAYLEKLLMDNYISNYKIMLLSTTKNNYKTIDDFNDYMKSIYDSLSINKIRISSLEEFVDLAVKSKIVISGRMHAMIISILFNNKIISIPFKNKLEIFQDEYRGKTVINIKKVEKLSYKSLENLYNMIE